MGEGRSTDGSTRGGDIGSGGAGAVHKGRPVVTAVAALVAVAVGLGIGALVWGPRGDVRMDGADARRAAELVAPASEDAAAIDDGAGTDELSIDAAPGGPADTPQAAVEQFLAAEAAGDLERSFGLLSSVTREDVGGSPARWIAVHADVLPPITGYEITSSEGAAEGRDQAQLTSVVGFESSLDEVDGLVPARARATWATVNENGAWRIDLGASTLEPVYPPDSVADDAVREWAAARQDCAAAPQWGADLMGDPALAERLCGSQGQIAVSEAAPLTAADATTLVSAFGPDVQSWARVVELTAPVGMRPVVAPLDNAWVVIGVLPPANE